MLLLSSKVTTAQVLSLRVGQPVAQVTGALINPANLKIEGFYCQDRFDNSELVLLGQDIRETSPAGYVINDHDVLAEAKDLVRLQKIISLRYNPIDKLVVTSNGEKVGKVTDYSVDTNSMYISKIYVARKGLLNTIAGGQLIVDRSQVIETTPQKIIITDLLRAQPAGAVA